MWLSIMEYKISAIKAIRDIHCFTAHGLRYLREDDVLAHIKTGSITFGGKCITYATCECHKQTAVYILEFEARQYIDWCHLDGVGALRRIFGWASPKLEPVYMGMLRSIGFQQILVDDRYEVDGYSAKYNIIIDIIDDAEYWSLNRLRVERLNYLHIRLNKPRHVMIRRVYSIATVLKSLRELISKM